MVAGVTFRNFDTADVDWLVEAHGALYARDEGFDDSFAPLVHRILLEFLSEQDPALERGWVAQHETLRLGSIFCVKAERKNWAKLRLFLVLPEGRGVGLGQQLLDTCLSFARGVGYEGITLWTHQSHVAACALYKKNGFEMVAEKPVHSFGCDLVEQTWEIVF